MIASSFLGTANGVGRAPISVDYAGTLFPSRAEDRNWGSQTSSKNLESGWVQRPAEACLLNSVWVTIAVVDENVDGPQP